MSEQKVDVVAKGDFVEVSFEARKGAGGGVFEKTDKPLLVVAGAGQVIRGLDELLVGSEVGQQRKELVPKQSAFGERRPELLKIIALSEFQKRGIDPAPGHEIDVDGMPGRVQSVNGGRVRIDFNPELAGYDLEYDFKVEKRFVAAGEKLEALRKHFLEKNAPKQEGDGGKQENGVKMVFDEKTGVVTVEVGDALARSGDYLVSKGHFVAQALAHVPEVGKVVFREEYSKKQ